MKNKDKITNSYRSKAGPEFTGKDDLSSKANGDLAPAVDKFAFTDEDEDMMEGDKERRDRRRQHHNTTEKRRKERISLSINRLHQILPHEYTTEKKLTLHEIVEKATVCINDMKEKLDRCLLGHTENVKGEEMERLRQQVRDLSDKNKQYESVLKMADIPEEMRVNPDLFARWKTKKKPSTSHSVDTSSSSVPASPDRASQNGEASQPDTSRRKTATLGEHIRRLQASQHEQEMAGASGDADSSFAMTSGGGTLQPGSLDPAPPGSGQQQLQVDPLQGLLLSPNMSAFLSPSATSPDTSTRNAVSGMEPGLMSGVTGLLSLAKAAPAAAPIPVPAPATDANTLTTNTEDNERTATTPGPPPPPPASTTSQTSTEGIFTQSASTPQPFVTSVPPKSQTMTPAVTMATSVSNPTQGLPLLSNNMLPSHHPLPAGNLTGSSSLPGNPHLAGHAPVTGPLPGSLIFQNGQLILVPGDPNTSTPGLSTTTDLHNQGVLGGPLPLVNNMLHHNFLGPNSGMLSTSAVTSTVTQISSSVPSLMSAPPMLMPHGLIMNNGQMLMPPQQMMMGQDMLLGNQSVLQGQSGNVISMNTVPSQPNQLPSALVLPNGQIVPVVSQSGMMPLQAGALGGGLLMPTGPPTTTPNPALPVLNIPRLPMPTASLTNTSTRLPMLTGMESKQLRPLISLSDTGFSTTAPKFAGSSGAATRPLLSATTDRNSPVIGAQGLITTAASGGGGKPGAINTTNMPGLPANGTVIMSADGTILFTLPPGANPGNLMLDASGMPLPTPATSQASVGKPKKPGQRVLMPKPAGGIAGFQAFGDASGAFVMSPLDPQLAKFATLGTVAPATEPSEIAATRAMTCRPQPTFSAITSTSYVNASQATTTAAITSTSVAETPQEPSLSQAGPTDILAQAAESIFASSEMSPTLSNFYNPAHEDNPLQIDTSLAEGEDPDIKKERQTPQTVAAPSIAVDITKLGTQDSRPAMVSLSTVVCTPASSTLTSAMQDCLSLSTLMPGMVTLAQTAASLPAPIMSTGLAPNLPVSSSAPISVSIPTSNLLSMPLLTTSTVNASSGGGLMKLSAPALNAPQNPAAGQPMSMPLLAPPPSMLMLGTTATSSTVTTVTAAQPGMGTIGSVPMKAPPQAGAASLASSTFPQPLSTTTTTAAPNAVTQIETPDSTSEKTKHHKKKKKSRSRSRSRKHGEKEGEEGKAADGSSEKSKEKSKEKKEKSKKNKKKSKKSKSSSKDAPVKVINATDGGIVAEKIEFMPKSISVSLANQVIQLDAKPSKKTKSSEAADGEPLCKKPRQTALEQELHSAMQGLSPLAIELMDDSDTIKLAIPEVQASDLNESIVTFMHSDSKEVRDMASPSSSMSPVITSNTWKRMSPGKLHTPSKVSSRKKVEEIRVEVSSRKDSMDVFSPYRKKKEPANLALSPVKTSSLPVTTASPPASYSPLSKASLSLTSSSTQTKHVPAAKKPLPVVSASKIDFTTISSTTTSTPSYSTAPAMRPSSMPLVEVSTPSLPSLESPNKALLESLESLAASSAPSTSTSSLLSDTDKTAKLAQPKVSPTLEAIDFTSMVPMTPPPPVVPKSSSLELNHARHSNIAHLARGLTPSKHGSPVPTKATAYKQQMLAASGTTTGTSGHTSTYSSSTVNSAGNILTYTNLNTPQPAEKPSKCDMPDSPPPKPIVIETSSTKKSSGNSAASSSSPTSAAPSLYSSSSSLLSLPDITLSSSLTVATSTVPYQITSKHTTSTSLGSLTPGGSSIDEGYITSPGSISSIPGNHSPYSLSSYKPDLPNSVKSSSMPTPWPVPGPQPAALMSPGHHSPPAKSQLAKTSMAPPSSQVLGHKSDSSCSQGRGLSISSAPPSTLAGSSLSPNLLAPSKTNNMAMGATSISSGGKSMHSNSSSSGVTGNSSSSSIKMSGSSPSSGMNVPRNNNSSPLNITGSNSSGISKLSGPHNNTSSNVSMGNGNSHCGAISMSGNTPSSSMGMPRTNTPSAGMNLNNNISGGVSSGIMNMSGPSGQSGNMNMSRTNTPSGVNMSGSNASSCSMNLPGSSVPPGAMNMPGSNMGMGMTGSSSMSSGMNMQLGNTQSTMNNRPGSNTPGASMQSAGSNLSSGALNMPSGVMNMNNSTSPGSMSMNMSNAPPGNMNVNNSPSGGLNMNMSNAPPGNMNVNNSPSGGMNMNKPPSGGMNVNNQASGGMNVNNSHSGGMGVQGSGSMNLNSSSGSSMKLTSSSSPAGVLNPPSCNTTTTSPQQSHTLASSGTSRPPVPALSSCAVQDSAARTSVPSTTVPVSTVSTSPVTSVRTTSSSAMSVTSSTVAVSSNKLTTTKSTEPACSFSTQSVTTPAPAKEKSSDAPPAKKRSRKKASPEGGRSKAKSRASAASASAMSSSCSLADMQGQAFPLMNPWQPCPSPPPRGFLSGFGLPQSASPGFSFTLSSSSCAPSAGSMAHANSGPASVYSATHPQQFFPYPHLPPGSRPQYRPQGHQPPGLSLSHFNLPPHAAHNQLSPRGGQTQASRNTQKQTPPQSGLNNQGGMTAGGRMDTQSRSPRAPAAGGFLAEMGAQTGYGDGSLGLEDRSKCTRPLSHSPMMPAAGSQPNRHAPSPRTPQLPGNMTPFYSGMGFGGPPEPSNLGQSAQMLSPRYPGPGSASNTQQQRRPFDTPQLTPHFSASGYEPPSIQFSQASDTTSQPQMAPFRQTQPPKQTPPSAEDARPKSTSKASSSKSQRSKSSKKKQGYEVDTNLSNSIFDSGGGRSMTPVYQPLTGMSPPPSQRASVQPDAPTYLPSNLFGQPGRPLSNTTPLQHKGDMSTPFNQLFSSGRPQNGLGLQFQPGFGMSTPGHGQVPPSQQLPSHSSSMGNFNFSQIFPDITSGGQNEALNMSPIKFGTGGGLLPQGVMDHPSIPHPGTQGSGMYSQRPHMLHNMSINSLLAHNHGFEGRSMAPPLNGAMGTPFPPHAHGPSFGMHPPLNFQLHDH